MITNPAGLNVHVRLNQQPLHEISDAGPKRLNVIEIICESDGLPIHNIQFKWPLAPVASQSFIGVVNRSQRDIDEQKDIAASHAAERLFFRNHPSYRHMAERMGTPYLQYVLNQQLTNHIRETLPNLNSHLQNLMTEMESKIVEFRGMNLDDPKCCATTMIRLVHSFESEFLNTIHGHGGEVDTETLSGGAQISRIFHERYPCELAKIQFDDSTMRKEIRVAIQNIHGVRPGLFTPDKAFDAPVHKMIEKLRSPTTKCVDLVIERLLDMIQTCSGQLTRYPLLRDELVRLVVQRIRELEAVTKSRLSLFLDYQLAYLNTTHEEFIGFLEGDQKSKDVSKSISDQMIYQGSLWLSGPKKLRLDHYYFFVLTTDNLRWFTDNLKNELKYTLSLENLKQRSGDTGFLSKRPTIILFHSDPKINVYKDCKVLTLVADSVESGESWRAAFLRAGVQFEKDTKKEEDPNEGEVPDDFTPGLERQVELIRGLTDSYMKIIYKMLRDTTPKIIMFELINQLKTFLNTEILPTLYTQDPKRLLEESEASKKHREEMLHAYEATKDALDVIRDVMSKAPSVPLPPPVNDSWLEHLPESSSSGQSLYPPPTHPPRPITPPNSRVQMMRLVPSRPAPSNPPVRPIVSTPVSRHPLIPALPNRVSQFSHGFQSASTSNLLNLGSTGAGSTSIAASVSTTGLNLDSGSSRNDSLMNFDPLFASSPSSAVSTKPPLAPTKVMAMAERFTGSDSINVSNIVPRIPPRPM